MRNYVIVDNKTFIAQMLISYPAILPRKVENPSPWAKLAKMSPVW